MSEAKEGISIDQYIESMKPKQKNIYYFCASDRNTALSSPYMENFTRKKRNVLLMFEDIDEFVAMNMQTFKDKKLVAIDSPDEDFEPDLEGESENTGDDSSNSKMALAGQQQTEMEEFVKSILGSKISAVKFSTRLVNSPAVVTGFLSSTLRKMMKATLKGSGDAQLNMAGLPVTLELNPSHKIITYMYHLKDTNPEVAKLVAEQVYDNACIAAGILDDPRTMLDRLNNILEVTSQYAHHHGVSSSTPDSEAKLEHAESNNKKLEDDLKSVEDKTQKNN